MALKVEILSLYILTHHLKEKNFFLNSLLINPENASLKVTVISILMTVTLHCPMSNYLNIIIINSYDSRLLCYKPRMHL